MQIINYVRASLLKIIYSVFKLASAAPNDLDFARKVISAKNKDTNVRLGKLKNDSVENGLTKLKSKQYDDFLSKIKSMQVAEKDRCSLS